MSINLENLSAQELDALIKAAAEQKTRIRKARVVEVRAKLIAMARDEGYTIEELFADGRGRGGSTAGKSVAAKYRDPANPANTWTGRGKRPRWVEAALSGGRSMNDLLIG